MDVIMRSSFFKIAHVYTDTLYFLLFNNTHSTIYTYTHLSCSAGLGGSFAREASSFFLYDSVFCEQ